MSAPIRPVQAQPLGVTLIAEGVETREEARWLFQAGLPLQQGYFYARPALNALASGVEERLAEVLDRSAWSEWQLKAVARPRLETRG